MKHLAGYPRARNSVKIIVRDVRGIRYKGKRRARHVGRKEERTKGTKV